MNGFKFFRIFGAAFAILGVVLGVVMIVALGAAGLAFGAIFTLVGGIFFGIGHYFVSRQEQVLKNGTRYRGKIYAYQPDHSITINGAPAVSVVVRYFDETGAEREAVCPTNSNNVSIYPVGASVTFATYEGRYAVDEKSVDYDILDREKELMDDHLATAGHHHLIAVTCKSCAASYRAVEGHAERCPYCGTYAEV